MFCVVLWRKKIFCIVFCVLCCGEERRSNVLCFVLCLWRKKIYCIVFCVLCCGERRSTVLCFVFCVVEGKEEMNCCLWQLLLPEESLQDTDFQNPNWEKNNNTQILIGRKTKITLMKIKKRETTTPQDKNGWTWYALSCNNCWMIEKSCMNCVSAL